MSNTPGGINSDSGKIVGVINVLSSVGVPLIVWVSVVKVLLGDGTTSRTETPESRGSG
jgi:hypothetical protein